MKTERGKRQLEKNYNKDLKTIPSLHRPSKLRVLLSKLKRKKTKKPYNNLPLLGSPTVSPPPTYSSLKTPYITPVGRVSKTPWWKKRARNPEPGNSVETTPSDYPGT